MTELTDPWPPLPYLEWQDTCVNLQLRSQIVGKIRLAQTPWLNHSWHVTLYVTASGLTTGPIPYERKVFRIDFDFLEHCLVIEASDGQRRKLPLIEQAIADFYAAVFAALSDMGIHVRIFKKPSEIADGIPFDQDRKHRAYDAAAAQRFWRALLQTERVLQKFRSGFLGKASPVHFFWGSFDLAVTRFSGRTAPPHPGKIPALPDSVAREAYSHEVSSAGFWPGGGAIEYPAFYSYAYPQPEGFRAAQIRPAEAFYNETLGEFILPYDVVRTARSPEDSLWAFLQSTYEAAAECGGWDRAALECPAGVPAVPRHYQVP